MNLLSAVREMTDEEHRLLNEFISERFGISFPEERRTLLEGRLKPRLQALDLDRFMDYYFRLQYSFEEERQIFTHLITNNETYFFRETRQFETLFEEAWSELAEGVNNGSPVRVLCAGCSSGEEPYTLKIYSDMHRRTPSIPLEIDGFDIDHGRLTRARTAEYGQTSMRSASESQIRRFFSRTGSDLYTLNPSFRESIDFSTGNILDYSSYPRSGSYDVVFCRNVLIYFSEKALYRAVENFARALRPNGVLFLGHSESIIGLSNDFETMRFERCIAYRKVES